MSLRGAIASLTQGGPYTVTRTTVGSTVKGKYTPGGPATFPVAGSLQPVTGKELKDLPEGRRNDEVRVLYTTTELRPGSEPDKLSIDGDTWTVFKVERFDAFADTHYRVYVARKTIP